MTYAFWMEIRHAFRVLRRNPGFTAVAVVTLAVALGATTTVFSVVKAVLLDPLPYEAPDRIVDASILLPPGEEGRTREGLFDARSLDAWRRSGRTLEHLAAYRQQPYVLTGRGDAERIEGARVSPELFSLLGVAPVRGRTFDPADDETVGDRTALLSHGLWQRRFGGSGDVLGDAIALDGEPHTVVGVMPPGFFFPHVEVEIWTPLLMAPGEQGPEFVSAEHFRAVARLKDDASLEQGEQEAQAVLARTAELDGSGAVSEDTLGRARLVPLREKSIEGVDGALAVLSAAVGLVLLIACVNLASLLLARSAARQEELAVRRALGAGRLRLLRQGLTESVLLGLAGGAAGLLVSLWLHRLVPLVGGGVPRIGEVELDGGVLAFAFVLSILAGLVFGLFPSLESSSSAAASTPRGGGGSWTGGRAMSAFVVVEVALAVVLLVGAGLLLRSFVTLLDVDLGYEPQGVVTTDLEIEPGRHGGLGWSGAPLNDLLDRLERHPHVQAAGVVSYPPLPRSFAMISATVEGVPPGRTLVVPQMTSPGYREAMGLRLVEGRWLTPQEHAVQAPVAVIDETFVTRYLAGAEPLGRRIRIGSASLEIVGVVEGTRLLGLGSEPRPELFTSYHNAQAVSGAGAEALTLAIRVAGDPSSISGLLRSLLRELDPHLPVNDIALMEDRLSPSVARPRFYTVLLGTFAGIALVLAAAGLYGVLSYSVARQTREIGIRRSLGAEGRDILAMVLGRGLLLVLVGLGIGTAASLVFTRALAHLLFGITATDPLTYTLAGLLLLAVGAAAVWVPAYRAKSVDPMAALRSDY